MENFIAFLKCDLKRPRPTATRGAAETPRAPLRRAPKCHNPPVFSLPRSTLQTSSFNPCAIVPVYDHERAVARGRDGGARGGACRACWWMMARVKSAPANFSGSRPPCRTRVCCACRVNGGKGAAMIAGFSAAWQRGLQPCPADRRGRPARARGMCRLSLPRARTEPAALICGQPQFDRRHARGPPLWPLPHARPGVAEHPVAGDPGLAVRVPGSTRWVTS